MRIFLSAGEASGDAYGAALVREIRALGGGQPATFEGIGGPKLKAEGVHLYADSSHWGAISIVQAAKVFWRVFTTLHRLKHNIGRDKPGLLIAVDFGFANIRLCRYAKKFGWKVLYFVPPGSWRRDRQGKDLPIITDAIVTPFEWSAQILNGMGATAHWFGHPIKQLIQSQESSVERQDSIAVLPGSRNHEIEMNLPIIAEAVRGLAVRLEFALAPSVDLDEFKRTWDRLSASCDDLFTIGDTYSVLRRARAGIICSGTATLEAALCRCPMVVLYQLSPAMAREAKLIRMKRPKFISLPNILMDREIVPELVGVERIDPADLRAKLEALVGETDQRKRQLADFDELDRILGPADAITKSAELAIQLAADQG